jgi:hypothetical protein
MSLEKDEDTRNACTQRKGYVEDKSEGNDL